MESLSMSNNAYCKNRLYTTGEIAKELGISSAARLNNILEHKKVQFKRNGTWLLYSRYVDKGYVVMKQCELECGMKVYDRKWTEKGRIFIHSIFDWNITFNEIFIYRDKKLTENLIIN